MRSRRTHTEADEASSDDSGDGRLRRLLAVAGAAVAVAYLVRRLRSGGQRSASRPKARIIDVGEVGRATTTDSGSVDEADAATLDADAAAERAVENADETPAPPGEMEVAEELAEEALDEDVDAEERDETAGPDAEDAETGE
jgi:hypothetical protein